MSRKRIWGAALFSLALGVALLIAYLATRAPREEPAMRATRVTGGDAPRAITIPLTDETRIGVTWAVADTAPIREAVRAVGQIVAAEPQIATIASKVDGWVDHLDVNFTGQRVSRGDPLLAVYSPMLVSAQEDLLLAKRLGTDVAAGTPDAAAGASSLLDASRRRLAYWDVPDSDIKQVEETGKISKTITLRSPVSGVVIEKNVLAGQNIMAGQALYRVADLRSVWLEGEVFEQDLRAVRVGQRVEATFQALPGVVREGRITYLYPTLDPEARTAKVRAEFANPDLALKPGMDATIRFTSEGSRRVVSVPRTAVLSTGDRNLAFVKRPNGKLEPHELVLGMADEQRVQVLRGLVQGDTVVASATFLVDAESNLGAVMGGMGNMPGMDMTKPVGPSPRK
jgi:Cu(I)/Ag(I) efflux system membrane fusion protein